MATHPSGDGLPRDTTRPLPTTATDQPSSAPSAEWRPLRRRLRELRAGGTELSAWQTDHAGSSRRTSAIRRRPGRCLREPSKCRHSFRGKAGPRIDRSRRRGAGGAVGCATGESGLRPLAYAGPASAFLRVRSVTKLSAILVVSEPTGLAAPFGAMQKAARTEPPAALFRSFRQPHRRLVPRYDCALASSLEAGGCEVFCAAAIRMPLGRRAMTSGGPAAGSSPGACSNDRAPGGRGRGNIQLSGILGLSEGP